MKRCRECGLSKPIDDFYRDSSSRDGRRSSCKSCELDRRHRWHTAHGDQAIATARAWQARNPERYRITQERYNARRRSEYRADHLRRTFGLTLDAYDALLAQQGGRCATCGDEPAAGTFLHVDHDHDTGEIRGLLCVRCNNGLGLLRDSKELLLVAADYLAGDLEAPSTRALLRGMTVARARSLVRGAG